MTETNCLKQTFRENASETLYNQECRLAPPNSSNSMACSAGKKESPTNLSKVENIYELNFHLFGARSSLEA